MEHIVLNIDFCGLRGCHCLSSKFGGRNVWEDFGTVANKNPDRPFMSSCFEIVHFMQKMIASDRI